MKTGVWIKLTDDVYPPFGLHCLIGYEDGEIEHGYLFVREQYEDRIKYGFLGSPGVIELESVTATPTHFMLIPELKKG